MRALFLSIGPTDLDPANLAAADAIIGDAASLARLRRNGGARLYGLVPHLDEADQALDALIPLQPDGIFLLDARHGREVQQLSVKLAVREAEGGRANGATRIIARAGAQAAGLQDLPSFAGASARLEAFVFDAAALAVSLGIDSDTMPSGPIAVARSLVLFAAKAAGVPAFATLAPLLFGAHCEAVCNSARAEGFSGMLVLNEDQLSIVRAVFSMP